MFWCSAPLQAEHSFYLHKAGVGNVDPGGPVSLQSLTPTLIKHTQPSQLIKVFRVQLGFFSSGFELNSAGEWPSRINFPHPWHKL